MACDRLTPLDATFLELEEADNAAHMHIGSLMIYEARAGLPHGGTCNGARSPRHWDEGIVAFGFTALVIGPGALVAM